MTGRVLRAITQKVFNLPTWIKLVGSLVLLELAGTIVAFSLRNVHIAVLVFQAAVTTVLAAVTYSYAKTARTSAQATEQAAQSTDKSAQSIDIMARATVELAQVAQGQLAFLQVQTKTEERVMLQELLEELREAGRNPKPPFEMPAWRRHMGRFKNLEELSPDDRRRISECYEEMKKVHDKWPELQEEPGPTPFMERSNWVEKRKGTLSDIVRNQVRMPIRIIESYLNRTD